MADLYKPQGLGGPSTPTQPRVRKRDEDPPKKEEDDPNSVLNVLKRGFMPSAERADAEIAIRRRKQGN